MDIEKKKIKFKEQLFNIWFSCLKLDCSQGEGRFVLILTLSMKDSLPVEKETRSSLQRVPMSCLNIQVCPTLSDSSQSLMNKQLQSLPSRSSIYVYFGVIGKRGGRVSSFECYCLVLLSLGDMFQWRTRQWEAKGWTQ